MIDPAGGLYIEIPAPDLRFASLALLIALIFACGRRRNVSAIVYRTLIGLSITFAFWMAISGNGRYYLPGLMWVGPLTVAAVLAMPASVPMKVTTTSLLLGGQLAVVCSMYQADPWGIFRWRGDEPTDLVDHPVRHTPATFFTTSGNTFSALVPAFHSSSRWASIGGFYEAKGGTLEQARQQSILSSTLPKYLVTVALQQAADQDGNPIVEVRRAMQGAIATRGLSLRPDSQCILLNHRLEGHASPVQADKLRRLGFWLCPLYGEVAYDVPSAGPALPVRHVQTFEAIEQRCPRFFVPGGGKDSLSDALSVRHYAAKDTQLRVYASEHVYYRYYRSMNDTFIGMIDDVLSGRATVNCDKLAGRYVLPWNR